MQDISATGVKIRFAGNLSYQFNHSRMVSDCRMRMPDGSILEARLKVLGFHYNSADDISYIRCYFLELRDDNEMQLEELINSAIDRIPQKMIGL